MSRRRWPRQSAPARSCGTAPPPTGPGCWRPSAIPPGTSSALPHTSPGSPLEGLAGVVAPPAPEPVAGPADARAADRMMPTRISLMLIVPDADTAVTWYRTALGAELLWDLGGVAGLQIGGAPFFLHEANPDNPAEDSPDH